VDVSLGFVSSLDILAGPYGSPPYILFKLKEKERDEAISFMRIYLEII
jgi:hypothetical protein